MAKKSNENILCMITITNNALMQMSDKFQFNLVLLRFFVRTQKWNPIYSSMLEFVNISLQEFHYSISDLVGKIEKKLQCIYLLFPSATKTFRTWMFEAHEKAFLNFKLNMFSSPSDVSLPSSWISIHVSCNFLPFLQTSIALNHFVINENLISLLLSCVFIFHLSRRKQAAWIW